MVVDHRLPLMLKHHLLLQLQGGRCEDWRGGLRSAVSAATASLGVECRGENRGAACKCCCCLCFSAAAVAPRELGCLEGRGDWEEGAGGHATPRHGPYVHSHRQGHGGQREQPHTQPPPRGQGLVKQTRNLRETRALGRQGLGDTTDGGGRGHGGWEIHPLRAALAAWTTDWRIVVLQAVSFHAACHG